jgi:hypothetical protein
MEILYLLFTINVLLSTINVLLSTFNHISFLRIYEIAMGKQMTFLGERLEIVFYKIR